jgi:hypothetical protein
LNTGIIITLVARFWYEHRSHYFVKETIYLVHFIKGEGIESCFRWRWSGPMMRMKLKPIRCPFPSLIRTPSETSLIRFTNRVRIHRSPTLSHGKLPTGTTLGPRKVLF